MAKKAYLVLENGMIFEGEQAGADIEAVGELVFTTGVVGYLETLTDPAYKGQIVVQTFPLVGNYGVIGDDITSDIHPSGYVCSEICPDPSNFRSEYPLTEYLEKSGICAITGIDTRALTRIIRDCGPMNAKICGSIPGNTDDISAYSVGRAFCDAGVKEKKIYGCGNEKYRVILVDYGTSADIIGELAKRGCTVVRVPYDTSAEEIFADNPDGIVLSPGPGDPAECSGLVHEIRKMTGRRPILGIGLGHQLFSMAQGAGCVRMPCGHRGLGQPVKEIGGTRTYITSQNHGYAVVPESLPLGSRMSFVNANDRTCEGVEYRGQKCVTVQFTPCGETAFIYDQFITMMGGGNNAQG